MRNTLLYFLAALVIFPVMAQQQPEWQSQYAVGLNNWPLILMCGLIKPYLISVTEIMNLLLIT